jgi:hypothetical protein
MADTGQGATLTLATTGSIGVIRSLTLPEITIDTLDDSDLSTTGFKTYIKTDLAEPGTLQAEILWDATTNDLPTLGTAETVTVTFPIHTSGNTTNATFAGTGFISSIKMPDMQMGELQVATLTVQLDGKTDPAFTAEAA